MRGGILQQIVDLARDMANHISRQSTDSGKHGASFTDYAARALENHPLALAIDPVTILSELVTDPGAPRIMEQQNPSKFADCQLVLYASSSISIQLLVWMNCTTSIHDHNFNGAFRMIAGRSLHCSYDFHQSPDDVSCGVASGRLDFMDSEIIGPGDVRRIDAGRSFIHAAFHLDVPSVTLLVASPDDVETRAQYEYRGGMLAVDESGLPLLVARQVQALKILYQLEPNAFLPRLIISMSSAGLGQKYWILRALDRTISALPKGDRQRLYDAISGQHDGQLVLDALFREKLTYKIVSLRETYRDPVTRFVLGLLVNVKNPLHWPSLFQRYSDSVRSAVDAGAYGRALERIFDAPFWTGLFATEDVVQMRDFLLGLTPGEEGGGHISPLLHDNALFQTMFSSLHPVRPAYEGAGP